MKTLALLAATLLLGANSDPAIPQGQLIKSVDWDDAHSYSDDQHQLNATYFKAPDTGKIELTVTHSKTSKTQFTGSAVEGIYPIADIYPIDLEKLTAGSYAILGEVRAEKDVTGSSIVMWRNTENDNLPPVRALDATGNTFDLKPSDAWQPFWIPFDTKTARPIHLGVKLYLYGPGTFHFRNLRLVQYPDAPAPFAAANLVPQSVVDSARANLETVQQQYAVGVTNQLAVLEAEQRLQWAEAMFAGDRLAAEGAVRDGAKKRLALMDKMRQAGLLSSTEMAPVERELADAEATISLLETKPENNPAAPATRVLVIDWKSFVLGIAATLLTITCACSFSYLAKRLNRHRHERELRRIASLDS